MMQEDVLQKAKFDKRSVTMGILGAAYMGRLLHAYVNMVDIVLVEVSSSEDEAEDNRCYSDEDDVDCDITDKQSHLDSCHEQNESETSGDDKEEQCDRQDESDSQEDNNERCYCLSCSQL